MKSKVYFAPTGQDETLASVSGKAVRLAEAAGFKDLVRANRPCAVKTHFGEDKNTGFVKPEITAEIVKLVKEAGGLAFVTDTNTLYVGRRSNAVAHVQMAHEHGFTFEKLGAPVIIADGINGADQAPVVISGGKHFKEVRIASALQQAESAIVLTHVKGHCQMGMGGSIKNAGMGCSARAGKMAQHQGGFPQFKEAKCTACGTCVEWCPADAISIEGNNKAKLHAEKCIGCGECLALCPHQAIGFSWLTEGPELAEKVCEHALGFTMNKRGRIGYMNFVTHLTKNCDCMGYRQDAEYPDVGILASTDMVAIDKAACDLGIQKAGKDLWAEWWPESQYTAQFEYGQKLGLGRTDYELVELV